MTDDFEAGKNRAPLDWFPQPARPDRGGIRNGLERDHAEGPLSGAAAGTFRGTPTKTQQRRWQRCGRWPDERDAAAAGVREKSGVNVSTVFGTLGERAQARMGGAQGHPRHDQKTRGFWHQASVWWRICKTPMPAAVHMNTRMFWTPHASWFGGGPI